MIFMKVVRRYVSWHAVQDIARFENIITETSIYALSIN